jgi:hypothetical protein
MLAWEMAWPIGALILGVALAWALWRNHTRNRANDAITEEATRQEYAHPDSYEDCAEALRKQLR